MGAAVNLFAAVQHQNSVTVHGGADALGNNNLGLPGQTCRKRRAQGAAQETFEAFFRTFDGYRHSGKALDYLYVIAASKCKNQYRQKAEADLEDVPELPDSRMGDMAERLTEFSLDTFNGLVDYMTVGSDGSIDVTFRNGQAIKA